MDNQNLKAFLTVAETGSFSGAAEKLHLTQSAVSKRIALLEEQVAKKLQTMPKHDEFVKRYSAL